MKYKLEDLCTITSSKRIYRNEYAEKGIPFYRGKEIIEKSNGQPITDELYISVEKYNEISKKYGVPKKGDILITGVGTIGISYIVDTDERFYFKDGNLIWLKDFNEKINNQFIYIYLKSNEFKNEVERIAIGSTQRAITIVELKKLKIQIPSLDIQNKIVKIYNSINKKIKLNNQINDNLFKLEKALYKDFLEKLNNYRQEKLGELCKIKYGKGLPTTKIEKDGYPVYGGNGIIGYYHDFMYDDSQVLISCRGAASGNVIISKPKSFITNNSLVLECDRKYHHYLKQYSLDNYYYEYTTGSAQPQITIDNIKDIVINIPKDEELLDFNKNMEVLEQKCFSNLKEIERLEQLRDILLPKLMNGEIDLDKIEI